MEDPLGFLVLNAKPVGGRHCGACTLCCRVVPVEQKLNKPANQRCRYQTHKGCKVYDHLDVVSPSCRAWNCRWLFDPETRELRRPDRSHYVLDCMPDYIGVDEHDGAAPQSVMVMQVWVDPDYPDAHRDPALRRYIAHIAETRQIATLIRWGERRGMVVFAPCLMKDGEWHEVTSQMQSQHSEWRNPMQKVHDIAERLRREASR